MSYVKDDTFFVTNSRNVVEIYFDGETYNTEIELDDDKWNLLTLVFDSVSRNLNVYIFKPTPTRKTFKLNKNPFVAGGNLAFGGWQPPLTSSHFLPNGTFTGCLDDIRVWKDYINNVEVQGHWSTDFPTAGDQHMGSLWKIDTDSMEYHDEMNRYQLITPMKPFSSPSIELSQAPVTAQPFNYSLPFDPDKYLSRKKRSPPSLSVTSSARSVTPSQATQFCKNIFLAGQMYQ